MAEGPMRVEFFRGCAVGRIQRKGRSQKRDRPLRCAAESVPVFPSQVGQPRKSNFLGKSCNQLAPAEALSGWMSEGRAAFAAREIVLHDRRDDGGGDRSDPAALWRGDRRGLGGIAASGAVPSAPGRGGVRRSGRAARADGAGGLPPGAPRRARGRRCLSGHVFAAGAPLRVDPRGGPAGTVAPSGGVPGGDPGGSGSTAANGS